MVTIKTNSKKDVLIHIGIILSLLVILFLGFFVVYLPASTHHGESITVPDLTGKSVVELEEFLAAKDLRYELSSDSTYVVNAAPSTVISQYPKAGSKVKEGRKVYVTITMRTPPSIEMPDLTNLSLRSAQQMLQSFGLQLGEVKKVPDLAKDAVLGQEYQGHAIHKKDRVPKGAKIDLKVGDGLGNTEFDVPDLIGKPLEEAKVAILGSDLQVGSIIYDNDSDQTPGTVIKQNPPSLEGNKIRVGELIDLWVAGSKTDQPAAQEPVPQSEEE